jgi:hypothetical protein
MGSGIASGGVTIFCCLPACLPASRLPICLSACLTPACLPHACLPACLTPACLPASRLPVCLLSASVHPFLPLVCLPVDQALYRPRTGDNGLAEAYNEELIRELAEALDRAADDVTKNLPG